MIGKLFSKKGRTVLKGNVYSTLVYDNNHIDIVSDACRICYKGKRKDTKEERAEYIRSKVKMGHESILEHSNVISTYIFNEAVKNDELPDILPLCKYLNVFVNKIDEDEYSLVIGGSIRGYKHIIRNIRSFSGKLINAILDVMYQLHSCYFEDFIEENVMLRNKFIDIVEEEPTNEIQSDKVTIISVDDIDMIDKVLSAEDIRLPREILLSLVTVTIKFEDISRIISQQLTRHRVGITQLSQRYVNYSNAKFINPIQFKDNLDISKKYDIELFNGQVKGSFTAQELGDELMKIYPQLVDQKMLKEDARSFLPAGAETSLYMTFTIKGLLSFLELRTGKTAQAEVRHYANIIYAIMKDLYPDYIDYAYILPVYELTERELSELK